jgi:hypothetical protein
MQKIPAKAYLFHAGTSNFKEIILEIYLNGRVLWKPVNPTPGPSPKREG